MTQLPPHFVVATGNAGKVVEFRELLKETNVRIDGLDAYDPFEAAVEDADTFEGNALKKARHAAAILGLPCLADDSGLVVDALGGAPGVYSARYAGEGASDEENVDKLLKALDAIDGPRSARFMCCLALVTPSGEVVYEGSGRVEGEITRERRGSSGFGYDPVFQPVGREQTMAELGLAEKNRLSHRANACAILLQRIGAAGA
ncbi:MAG: RdgB/HAM1 family non-canonical purine NTP pyrophosphatase [Polyangiales bacterium]